MGVLEESTVVDGVVLDPVADRDIMNNAAGLAEATLRFRRARAAYIPALEQMLAIADEYRTAHQALIDAHRKANLPFREITLGRAWLGSHPVDGVDFRPLAFRAQERRVTPDGMLRP
jgi:hypothetical protein